MFVCQEKINPRLRGDDVSDNGASTCKVPDNVTVLP